MGPLYLHALGHFYPENVVDNRFLEELDVGTSDEWILERVGIRERRTVLPLDYIRRTRNADVRAGQEAALYSNVETGKRAATAALARAGIRPKDVGMVVAGGCCPEMAIPSEACRIAAALDIEAPALDINSACSSFAAQLHLLASMQGLPPYVLVVNPENTTRAVDYADRASCVLWGDGTSAAVVSRDAPSRVRIVQTTLASSPAGWAHVTIPRFGHFVQDGGAVQRFAIRTTLACLEEMLPAARARLAQTGGALHFMGHQANLLVLESVARRAKLADAEHWLNVVDRGNTGAAGAPGVLSQHWEELRAGDVVLLAVVGSGLTWSSLRMEVD
ncbi:MAG TPA: ketoacyl-ACP synthase III [Polyangiaceae bacterium]|nr:ketoacyl-ACP synthase III [Polyangiaceae bacterium]